MKVFRGICLTVIILALLFAIAFLVTCLCLKMNPVDYWHQVFAPSMKALFVKPPVA